MTAKEADEARVTLTWFAQRIGQAKDTLAKDLRDAGIEVGGRGCAAGIPLGQAVEWVSNRGRRQTSTDRRNEAQARKCEIETAILEKKYSPNDLLFDLAQKLGSRIAQEIKSQDDWTEDQKESLIQRWREIFSEFAKEIGESYASD